MPIRRLKRKKVFLVTGGFLASIAPLVVTVAIKWSDYTSTVTRSWSLGIGGVAALTLLFMKAIGKLPEKTKPIVRYGVAFGIVSLLKPLVLDLQLLLGMALAGEVAEVGLFEWQIEKVTRQIEAGYSAEAMKTNNEELIRALKEDAEGRS